MILEDKVVVVSGVGPGLGREVAAAALRDGARVVIGARSEDRLAKQAEELDHSGERVAWRRCDISAPGDGEALCALGVERFGGIDALVNCAALDTVFGGLKEVDWPAWRQTFEVNVMGSLGMTHAAIPHLEQRGGGAVVFIGSQSSMWPQVSQLAYGASKGALLSAMLFLAKELGPSRIRVNTVVPTWMWGPPVEGYVNSQAEAGGVPADQVLAGITRRMPLGEMPTDGDVAEAVVFLCSNRARMITGQSLLVNAGEYLRP